MKFTASLREEIKEIYSKIINLPFNQELMKGTLARDKFTFYIQQDSLYLLDYSKALALIAAKSEKTEKIYQFLQFAGNAIVVEKAMHEVFFKKYSIKPVHQKSPACFTYTSFLLSVAALRSIEEAIAAILPCFWIYYQVGNHIFTYASGNNPYQDWIDAYAGEEFKIETEKAVNITDEIAEQANELTRKKMKEMYIFSTKLEYMFWESAYRKEQWIV